MSLNRLIYISEMEIEPAHGSMTAQLASIMRASARNNAAAGVTGALVFDDGWFLQALEGERRAVWRTFERISNDERHSGCLVFEMVEIPERLFGNWWMGLATRDALTAPAFRPHLRGGLLKPDTMSAADILQLMKSLAKIGLHREMRDAA